MHRDVINCYYFLKEKETEHPLLLIHEGDESTWFVGES